MASPSTPGGVRPGATLGGPLLTPLSREVEEGGIEYKLHLLDPSPERLTSLVTQMMWRLREGSGSATYHIGVADDGVQVGLSPLDLNSSLDTLNAMAASSNACVTAVTVRPATVSPHLQVAEALVFKSDEPEPPPVSVNVATVGATGAGKSTLIACLVQVVSDDGNGCARFRVHRHRHEVEVGCTSSSSRHVLGFKSNTRLNACATGVATVSGLAGSVGVGPHVDLLSTGWTDSALAAASTSTVVLVDTPGATRFRHTALAAVSSPTVDAVQVVIDPTSTVHDAETVSLLQVVVGLQLPFFLTVSHMDRFAGDVTARLEPFLTAISETVAGCTSTVAARPTLVHVDSETAAVQVGSPTVVPFLTVSSVTRFGFPALESFLSRLRPLLRFKSATVSANVEEVVSLPTGEAIMALAVSSPVNVGRSYLLGPDVSGNLNPVIIKSLHVQRSPTVSAACGVTATAIGVWFKSGATVSLPDVRRGQVLIPTSTEAFKFSRFAAAVTAFEVEVYTVGQPFRVNAVCQALCATVRQPVQVVAILSATPTVGRFSRVKLRVRFMHCCEYLNCGAAVVLRIPGGLTVAVGAVLKLCEEDGRAVSAPPASGGGVGAGTSSGVGTGASAGVVRRQRSRTSGGGGDLKERRRAPSTAAAAAVTVATATASASATATGGGAVGRGRSDPEEDEDEDGILATLGSVGFL